ncbi:hypothetical protein MUB16_28480 [Priestia sp. OVL9]|nr:hypothetical protein [Priestia sp. OVL9]
MKNLIKAYQAGTSNEVVERIMDYVEKDLTFVKYIGEVQKVEDGLIYIAYRIKAFMMKNCFNKRNAKNLTENSHRAEDYHGLWELINLLHEAYWIDLDFDEIYRFNFESIKKNEKEIRAFIRNDYVVADLFNLIEMFKGLSGNSEEFKADYKITTDELQPLFVEALKYALLKVDADRGEKEIVKYINKAMLTKFIELQMKAKGVKRIRKANQSVYIKPEVKEHQDAWMLMFGKTLKHVGLDSFDLYLTKKQKIFIEAVHEIVETDLKANNIDAFKWTKDNNPVLNKRYLAGRMGMEETNFKQTLKRCEKKIHDNWKEAMNNYLERR